MTYVVPFLFASSLLEKPQEISFAAAFVVWTTFLSNACIWYDSPRAAYIYSASAPLSKITCEIGLLLGAPADTLLRNIIVPLKIYDFVCAPMESKYLEHFFKSYLQNILGFKVIENSRVCSRHTIFFNSVNTATINFQHISAPICSV